jgi:NADH dehydrogenase
MTTDQTDLVTGAFGFTGSCVATRLRESGVAVRTLTNHPRPEHSLAKHVAAVPYRFDDPRALAESLHGVRTVYNTYWVRFDYGETTHRRAVENTKRLFRAAIEAGVQRFVHVSIANPSLDSPLPYYRGKAELEGTLRASGLSHAIVRPTVIFGPGGLLINNIAWLLRRLPVFAVIGNGDYRIQPVFVEDLAELLIDAASARGNLVMDAVGPETYRYIELVKLLRKRIGASSKIVHVPPKLALACARIVSWFVDDVLITREEVDGLLSDLLVSHQPPHCRTSLREWLDANRERVGIEYISELGLHYRDRSPTT